MELIARGEAHLVTLDGGDVFYAGSQFGMKPIMGEEYDYGTVYGLLFWEHVFKSYGCLENDFFVVGKHFWILLCSQHPTSARMPC